LKKRASVQQIKTGYISRKRCKDRDFVDRLANILQKAGIPD
jgi:hypothetical protein